MNFFWFLTPQNHATVDILIHISRRSCAEILPGFLSRTPEYKFYFYWIEVNLLQRVYQYSHQRWTRFPLIYILSDTLVSFFFFFASSRSVKWYLSFISFYWLLIKLNIFYVYEQVMFPFLWKDVFYLLFSKFVFHLLISRTSLYRLYIFIIPILSFRFVTSRFLFIFVYFVVSKVIHFNVIIHQFYLWLTLLVS